MFGSDSSAALALLAILPSGAPHNVYIVPSLQGGGFRSHLSPVDRMPWGVTGPAEHHNQLDPN